MRLVNGIKHIVMLDWLTFQLRFMKLDKLMEMDTVIKFLRY